VLPRILPGWGTRFAAGTSGAGNRWGSIKTEKAEGMTIRAIVADDHEVVRKGLGAMLKGSGIEIIAEASTRDEVVAKTLELRPDLVLMDVRMPNHDDGLLALESIRASIPNACVVMFSAYDNPTYVARSAAMGAADYLLKSTPRQDLVDALTRVASGMEAGENSILQRVKRSMVRRKNGGENDVPLTNRELQVLRHVALGLSNREIGTSLQISIETVKEHVQNILRKLDVNDRTQAAVWAVRRNLS
jgi:DNA-binding NarL/FixJ family response regulator